MKQLIAGITLAALAGCTTATMPLAPIGMTPTASLLTAANTANPFITAATGYITYCTVSTKGCDSALIKTEIEPKVHALQTARNAALDYLKANPTAAYAPSVLLTSVQTATVALETVEKSHNITGAVK